MLQFPTHHPATAGTLPLQLAELPIYDPETWHAKPLEAEMVQLAANSHCSPALGTRRGRPSGCKAQCDGCLENTVL